MVDTASPDVGTNAPFPDFNFKEKGSYELLIVCDEVARVGEVELAARILDHCREAKGWIAIKLTDLLRTYSGKDDPTGWTGLTSRLMRLAAAGLVTSSQSSEEVRVTTMFTIAVRKALYIAN